MRIYCDVNKCRNGHNLTCFPRYNLWWSALTGMYILGEWSNSGSIFVVDVVAKMGDINSFEKMGGSFFFFNEKILFEL